MQFSVKRGKKKDRDQKLHLQSVSDYSPNTCHQVCATILAQKSWQGLKNNNKERTKQRGERSDTSKSASGGRSSRGKSELWF